MWEVFIDIPYFWKLQLQGDPITPEIHADAEESLCKSFERK